MILDDLWDALKSLLVDLFSFTLDAFLDLFDDFFSPLADFFYELLFVDLKDSFLSAGKSISNYFFDNFSNSPISFDFFLYYIGFIFIIFVVRQVVSILR